MSVRAKIQKVMRDEQNMLRLKRRSVTSDVTLSSQESGTTVDNSGATATVTVTLPTAPGPGCSFKFHVVADYTLRVDPGSDDGFFHDGSQQTDGNYIDLTRLGTWMQVTADTNGNWVTQWQGTTQVQA